MRIGQTLLEYVDGATFSELLKTDVVQHSRTRHRFDVIESLVRGANVIHVGCIDHLPLLAQKIGSGTWLHARLSSLAQRCIGIDINAEGVAAARSVFRVDNVFYGDIAADAGIAPILAGHWDYVILGEMLEHVDNPVAFLASVVANYGDRIDRLVITVPNAFRAGNLLAALRGQEWINSDHRYWFTPYTLLKVLSRAGLAVEMLELCHFSNQRGIKRALKNLVLQRFPLFCEDLVAVCRPRARLEGEVRMLRGELAAPSSG